MLLMVPVELTVSILVFWLRFSSYAHCPCWPRHQQLCGSLDSRRLLFLLPLLVFHLDMHKFSLWGVLVPWALRCWPLPTMSPFQVLLHIIPHLFLLIPCHLSTVNLIKANKALLVYCSSPERALLSVFAALLWNMSKRATTREMISICKSLLTCHNFDETG